LVAVAVKAVAAVDVRVLVEVEVRVTVDVAVPVEVGVGAEVDSGFGLDVEVKSGRTYTSVLVGFVKTGAVLVATTVVVGTVVWVVANVPGVDVLAGALAVVESCGMVANDAPGVRKASIHAGFVRMAESIGSMNPSGLLVRKSLFGSILDCTFVSNSQRGVKRSAQPPASRIHKSPNRRMKAMSTQSRLSFSVVLMNISIKRQTHMDRGARIRLFVMTGAFDPDVPMVCDDNPAGDGKPQAGPTTFEFGFSG